MPCLTSAPLASLHAAHCWPRDDALTPPANLRCCRHRYQKQRYEHRAAKPPWLASLPYRATGFPSYFALTTPYIRARSLSNANFAG
ncbi:hypothetical protein SVAN01_01198 [Stagonosporopsis vannaccii]|nr:hypothetical protein SVAN01_01198 [Stagonosporopsis vannaccii]